jgi:hypothetical protein
MASELPARVEIAELWTRIRWCGSFNIHRGYLNAGRGLDRHCLDMMLGGVGALQLDHGRGSRGGLGYLGSWWSPWLRREGGRSS